MRWLQTTAVQVVPETDGDDTAGDVKSDDKDMQQVKRKHSFLSLIITFRVAQMVKKYMMTTASIASKYKRKINGVVTEGTHL